MKALYLTTLALCLSLAALATQPVRRIPILQANGSIVYEALPDSLQPSCTYCPSSVSHGHQHPNDGRKRALNTSTADGLGRFGQTSSGVLRSIGAPRIPVLLVEFSDVSFQPENTAAVIDSMFNYPHFRTHPNYARGSVRDYFTEQSYGQFTPSFHILGKVRLSHTRQYYGQNVDGSTFANAGKFRQEALQLAAAQGIDFSPFVEDDGVPIVVFIFAGPGEHNSFEAGKEDYLWPHFNEGSYAKAGEVQTKSYFIGNELVQSYTRDANGQPQVAGHSLEGIGVFCHELSHALGLPDFYPTRGATTADFYTPSYHDLMDYGQYVGAGHRPIGYSAYERSYMGWLSLTELKEQSGSFRLTPLHYTQHETDSLYAASQKPEQPSQQAYLIRNPQNEHEYLLLENRNNSKWFVPQLGEGLLIYHINFDRSAWLNNRLNNNPAKLLCQIVPADGTNQVTRKNPPFSEFQGDFYGTSNDKRELSASSNPAFAWQTAGAVTPLFDIQLQSDGSLTFTYREANITGISAASNTSSTSTQPIEIYGLDGRRYTSQQLSAGFYILNGKKQLIR